MSETATQTAAKKRCVKHQWERLYKQPLADSPLWRRMPIASGEYYLCASCGCLGSIRQGFTRGGGHALKPILGSRRGDEAGDYYSDIVRDYKAKAAEWNAQVEKEPNQ